MKKELDSKPLKPVFKKEKLKKAIEVLEALDNPFREKILKFVQAHPDSTVTTIIKGVRKVQSFVSKHLKVLRINSFLTNKKSGKEVHYTLNQEKIADTNEAIDLLAKAS